MNMNFRSWHIWQLQLQWHVYCVGQPCYMKRKQSYHIQYRIMHFSTKFCRLWLGFSLLCLVAIFSYCRPHRAVLASFPSLSAVLIVACFSNCRIFTFLHSQQHLHKWEIGKLLGTLYSCKALNSKHIKKHGLPMLSSNC